MDDVVAPVTTPTPEQPAAAPQPEEPNRIQKRISQLVGTAHEQTERADAYAAQVQELRAQLQATQEELAAVRSRPVLPQTPEQSPVVPPVAGQDWSRSVAEVVQKAVGSEISKLRQEQALVQLRQAQRQSFERVVSEIPDLANPQSDLYRAADQILSSLPQLRQLPNAPELAAFLARGLMGSGPVAPSPQQRVIAGAPAAVSRGPTPVASPQDQIKALETQLDATLKRMRETPDMAESTRLWGDRGGIVDAIEALKKKHNLQ